MMRIPLWRDLRLSVWEKQNPEAVKVAIPNTQMRTPVRRVLSMRGWMLLLVRYDWKKSGRYFRSHQDSAAGVREVRIRVSAPTEENAEQWAQTIADLVTAEHGQEMRLDITVDDGDARREDEQRGLAVAYALLRAQLEADLRKMTACAVQPEKPGAKEARAAQGGIASGIRSSLAWAIHHFEGPEARAAFLNSLEGR